MKQTCLKLGKVVLLKEIYVNDITESCLKLAFGNNIYGSSRVSRLAHASFTATQGI